MPTVHPPSGHHPHHPGPTSMSHHQASSSNRARSPSSPLRSALKKPKAANTSPNDEDPVSEAAMTSTMDHRYSEAAGAGDGDTVTVTSLGIPALRAARSTASMFNSEPMTALAEEDSVRASPARGMVAAAPQAVATTSTTLGNVGLGSPMSDADETARVVRQLLETEVGLNVLLEQVKRNLVSAKDVVTFLKKRASIEEEYGKSLQRLCTSMSESLDKDEGKGGAYSECIRQMVSIHDTVATNRLAFATNITQVAEELNTVHKDTERSRRQLKDAGERHEKNLTASEQALEKAKAKHEAATEAWERARQTLADQSGLASSSVGSLQHGAGGGGGMVMTSNGQGRFGMTKLSSSSSRAASFFGMNKNPEKEEEQARHRAARANDAYQSQLSGTVATRAEFQTTHLPGLLRSLKEVNDECDIALQYHLSKYAFHYEQTLTADAHALCPSVTAAGAAAVAAGNPLAGGMGIRKLFEHMDHAGDLQKVIEQAAGASTSKGTGSAGPRPLAVAAATSTAALSSLSLVGPPTRPIFGVSLMDLAERDDSDVPRLLSMLTRLVEEVGIEVVGLYRASGSHPVIQRLRALCDRDLASIPWRSEEIMSDVHNITGLLKLFLRSLPDSVIPKAMTREFVGVAKMSNDPRNQLLSLHEIINRLPDPHYATLRLLIQHLDRVAQHAGRNRMSWANLSIVFGPALMHSGVNAAAAVDASGKAASGKGGDSSDGGSSGTDMHYQCKVVELILKNFRILFEAED
ncbi:hypothetical protein BCR44DRAFT_41832, partial [Catenaria anguillulae PL171]